ncbi:hypothetical protein MIR68_003052 [Amoeboaphelidium protococcarum]|nr:hypothetical protein MIR68_003052 [Amoeboaphelidium protococcarum]
MPIVDGKFCFQQKTLFIMKNFAGAFSCPDYEVRDQEGRLWFKLESKAFSNQGFKTLLDSNGQPVLKMKRKCFSLKYRIHLPGNHQALFVFKPQWTWTPQVQLFLGDGKGKKPDFLLKGSFGS